MFQNIVAKFGGSSVKDARAMLGCAKIVNSFPSIRVVILSATYSTTNELEQIVDFAIRGLGEKSFVLFNFLKKRHLDMAYGLKLDKFCRDKISGIFFRGEEILNNIMSRKKCSDKEMAEFYSIGETLSTSLFLGALKLKCRKRNVKLIPATELIMTNKNYLQAIPIISETKKKVKEQIGPLLKGPSELVVTEGFLGRDGDGRTTTLGREGSDFSGALLAEGIEGDLLQIWTDVPGIFSADPRVFKNTQVISKLSFKQADLMARFGAKILFPKTLRPLIRQNIPLQVVSSLEPLRLGSFVQGESVGDPRPLSISVFKNIFSVELKIDPATGDYFLSRREEFIRQLETLSIFSLFDKNSLNCRFFFESTREQYIANFLSLKKDQWKHGAPGEWDIYFIKHLNLITLVGHELNLLPWGELAHLKCLISNNLQRTFLCDFFDLEFWQEIHDQFLKKAMDYTSGITERCFSNRKQILPKVSPVRSKEK